MNNRSLHPPPIKVNLGYGAPYTQQSPNRNGFNNDVADEMVRLEEELHNQLNNKYLSNQGTSDRGRASVSQFIYHHFMN